MAWYALHIDIGCCSVQFTFTGHDMVDRWRDIHHPFIQLKMTLPFASEKHAHTHIWVMGLCSARASFETGYLGVIFEFWKTWLNGMGNRKLFQFFKFWEQWDRVSIERIWIWVQGKGFTVFPAYEIIIIFHGVIVLLSSGKITTKLFRLHFSFLYSLTMHVLYICSISLFTV